MFFNLFKEAEPLAAILIAHGTHVFWGTPEARIRGRRLRAGEGFLGRGHQLEGLEERCKLPQQGSGQSPDHKIHFGPTKSLENASRGHK